LEVTKISTLGDVLKIANTKLEKV
jgi:dynein heavy chain